MAEVEEVVGFRFELLSEMDVTAVLQMAEDLDDLAGRIDVPMRALRKHLGLPE